MFARASTSAALGELRHTRILPPRLCVLLHYESASVPRWMAKFADAAAVERRRHVSTKSWIDEQGFDDDELAKIRQALLERPRHRRDGDPAPARADGRTSFYSASAEVADQMHAAATSGDAAAIAAASWIPHWLICPATPSLDVPLPRCRPSPHASMPW